MVRNYVISINYLNNFSRDKNRPSHIPVRAYINLGLRTRSPREVIVWTRTRWRAKDGVRIVRAPTEVLLKKRTQKDCFV